MNEKHNSEIHVSYTFIPMDAVSSLALAATQLNDSLRAQEAEDVQDDATIQSLSVSQWTTTPHIERLQG